MTLDWVPAFGEYLNHLVIDSKETGRTILGKSLYGTQKTFVREVQAGLENDVHNFLVLKGRQEGISTITLALDLFWAFLHPGLQGAIVTDTEINREGFRATVVRYMESLPKQYRVGWAVHNRNQLILKNGSVLNYLVAGTRGSGRLSRGKGLNFVHATEISSWAGEEDIVSLMASLAENDPKRLYIFESTARGFNKFQEMWEDAEEALSQKRIFLGWWLKDTNRIPVEDARYTKYIDGTYSDYETDQIAKVKKLYKFDVSDEQLAWYRWKLKEEIKAEHRMQEEFPWTEEEAFVMSGSKFFPARLVSDIMEHARRTAFKGYRFHVGDDFFAMQGEQVRNPAHADLKVWEPPHPRGIYVVGADPATGDAEWGGDLFAIQVMRAYADCLVQVAEYAALDIVNYQFAWVLADIMGAYGNVYLNLEVNGPGMVVFQELRKLRSMMQAPSIRAEQKERDETGLLNIFANVKNYLYHRPDSMGTQYAYHWKTNADNKRQIFVQLKDALTLRQCVVNSVRTVDEFQTIIRDGNWVGADGTKKDDRTMAMALSVRHWIDWVRAPLIQTGRTYQVEAEADKAFGQGRDTSIGAYQLQDFWRRQKAKRLAGRR